MINLKLLISLINILKKIEEAIEKFADLLGWRVELEEMFDEPI